MDLFRVVFSVGHGDQVKPNDVNRASQSTGLVGPLLFVGLIASKLLGLSPWS
jgi:hypothetical protein